MSEILGARAKLVCTLSTRVWSAYDLFELSLCDVLAWLHVQVATEVVSRIRHSELAVRFVVLLLILGFPAALVLSWVFETRQKESALGSCCA